MKAKKHAQLPHMTNRTPESQRIIVHTFVMILCKFYCGLKSFIINLLTTNYIFNFAILYFFQCVGQYRINYPPINLWRVLALFIRILVCNHLKQTHTKCIYISWFSVIFVVHFGGHEFRGTDNRFSDALCESQKITIVNLLKI